MIPNSISGIKLIFAILCVTLEWFTVKWSNFMSTDRGGAYSFRLVLMLPKSFYTAFCDPVQFIRANNNRKTFYTDTHPVLQDY